MRKIISFFIFSAVLLMSQTAVLAKWGTFTVTDNNGEQVTVKHGLLSKKVIVKDRYGDGFGHSRSIFGLTKSTEVSALNNDVNVHKGLFGFGKTEGHDMLGDSFSSNKNLLFRNTHVDLSGANNLMNKVFSKNSSTPPISPPVAGQTYSPVPSTQSTPLVDTNKFSNVTAPAYQNN